MLRICYFLIALVALAIVGLVYIQLPLDRRTPGRCEVHDRQLEDGVVPIHYGLVRCTKEEGDARQKGFPHARSDYLGGCVVKPPEKARVSFCPECRKAEAEWMAEHRPGAFNMRDQ